MRYLLFLCLLTCISSCKLDLDQAYDTRRAEYFRTQLEICIVQQFRNCAIPGNTTAPSNLSYVGNPFVFTKNVTITPVNPVINGEGLTYSVNPSLPSGLSINSATGQLSGTPLAVANQTNYTVTASNANGSTNFDLTITVNFNPATVPGLKFWVRAEDLALPNSSSVNSWADLSGTGNTVILGNAPTYFSSANTINGRPVVRFVHNTNNLINTAPIGVSSSDSASIFFVLRSVTNNNHNVLFIGPPASGGRQIQIVITTGVLEINKSNAAVAASVAASWTVGVIKQAAILQNASTNITFRLNGIQVGSLTPNPGASGYTAGNLGIGINGAGIDLAELLYYDNRIADKDVIDIDCYLGTRYGTSTCP